MKQGWSNSERGGRDGGGNERGSASTPLEVPSYFSAASSEELAVYRHIANSPLLPRLRLYDTRCYFNVRSKADMSQLNLPHGNNN